MQCGKLAENSCGWSKNSYSFNKETSVISSRAVRGPLFWFWYWTDNSQMNVSGVICIFVQCSPFQLPGEISTIVFIIAPTTTRCSWKPASGLHAKTDNKVWMRNATAQVLLFGGILRQSSPFWRHPSAFFVQGKDGRNKWTGVILKPSPETFSLFSHEANCPAKVLYRLKNQTSKEGVRLTHEYV